MSSTAMTASNAAIFKQGLVEVLPHLRAFARGLCGNPDLADDLVQETAIKAWNARDRFEPGTSLRAWTFTILRNCFLNELRKSSRLVELDEDVHQSSMKVGAAQEDAIHLDDVNRALQKLPEERREALLLVGAGGLSYEEAANIAGVAVGTMKSRISRGRAELNNLLGQSSAAEIGASLDV